MEEIELRSENVRKIIGKIPPMLIRSGISIIALILVLLLAAAAFIPYPETIEGNALIVRINNEHVYAKGRLPYSYVTQVKKGMEIELELEGYVAREYGYQHGIVENISREVITIDKKNYFSYSITLKKNKFIRQGMKGNISIVLSNNTLLKKILSKKKE